MKAAIPVPVLVVLLATSVITACELARSGPLERDTVYVSTNLRIRERVHREIGTIVPGSYFTYSATPTRDDSWRTALTFRHDALLGEGPRRTVRFVDGRTAFIHIGWVYAVTTDGGATWHHWDAARDLPGWGPCCNYGLIDSVALRKDGNGEMYLSLIENPRGIRPLLTTRDYGVDWVWADPLDGRRVR